MVVESNASDAPVLAVSLLGRSLESAGVDAGADAGEVGIDAGADAGFDAGGLVDAGWVLDAGSQCPDLTEVQEVTFGVAGGTVNLPRSVWTGSSYTLLWYGIWPGGTQTEVTTQLLSSNGTLSSAALISPDDGAPGNFPRMAYSGTQLGIAYSDDRAGVLNRAVYFALATPAGALVAGSERLISGAGGGDTPAIAWNPLDQEWLVVLQRDTSIYFLRFDVTGSPIGTEALLLTNAKLGDTGNSPLLWNSARSTYAAAWTTSVPKVGEISRTGALTWSATVSALAGNSYRATLATTGAEYGVIWTDGRMLPNKVYFARVIAGGAAVAGSEVLLGSAAWGASEGTVVWNGAEYVAAWVESVASMNTIFTSRVGSSGIVAGSRRALTCSRAFNWWPELQWNGSVHSLTYQHDDPALMRHEGKTLLFP